MVKGGAAADAIARAKRLPKLHVGLHLVVIEGSATLPAHEIPHLVDRAGWFGSDQARRGLRYFADPRARNELAREIRAQFEAFAATGLPLDHANAHKHMHLHPTVGRLLIQIGQEFGLRAVRVPSEPAAPLADGPQTLGERALQAWTKVLRAQIRRAGLVTTDHCFGLRWTGHMTRDRVLTLAENLPPGTSEIYFHPATHTDPTLSRLMPTYAHVSELAALRDPSLAARLSEFSTVWRDLDGRGLGPPAPAGPGQSPGLTSIPAPPPTPPARSAAKPATPPPAHPGCASDTHSP